MIKMKLNNQIVCFCSSRNTSFLHEEKKKKMEKTKILKRKTHLFYIYLVCMNVYTVHIWHIHTQLNHSTQRSMITEPHYTVNPTNKLPVQYNNQQQPIVKKGKKLLKLQKLF